MSTLENINLINSSNEPQTSWCCESNKQLVEIMRICCWRDWVTQWRADSLRFCHGYSPLKIAISQNTIQFSVFTNIYNSGFQGILWLNFQILPFIIFLYLLYWYCGFNSTKRCIFGKWEMKNNAIDQVGKNNLECGRCIIRKGPVQQNHS